MLLAGLARGGADDLLLQIEAEIQKRIRNSSKLQDLLNWAHQLTDGSASELNPVAKRAIAISHAIIIAKTIDSAIASTRFRAIDSARASIIDSAIAIASANTRAINSVIAIASRIASPIDRAIDRARAIDIAIDKARASPITIAIAIDSASASISELEKASIFKDASFAELISKLKALRNQKSIDIKHIDVIYQTWLDALKLTPEMIYLSREEWETFRNYLEANYFLIECKEAAVRVSAEVWEGIESQMLRVEY